MSSQLRVDNILPSASTALGIGTASGSITFNSNISGNTIFNNDVTVGGVLTYEDVTNIDSVGVVTARNGLHVTGGSVGIGTDDPQEKLTVAAASPAVLINATSGSGESKLQFGRVGNTNIGEIKYEHSSNAFSFRTNDTANRVRIDSSGRLLVGANSSSATSSALLEGNSASGSSTGTLTLARGQATPSDGAALGQVNFTDNTHTTAGYIIGQRDGGSWSGSSLPSRIVFGTTADGASSPTERLRITSDGKVGINNLSPSYMLEVENPNPGDATKQLIQRWVNNNQNTLELHMYGGSVDQVQFATTNSEQTLSFLTGEATGDVVSTQTSLLLTQNRDAWLQGPNASNYGGALFIGHEASPYGNLGAYRDTNNRPLIYLGGKYPEITLANTVPTNSSHGPTLRFTTYVQSTNTATGSQFVIGTNGAGTYLDIGHATAAQNANVHNGISNYAGSTRFRVTTSGCQVLGSFSKSSGAFRIDHPLVGLSTTHDLVHSFLEGPQADLIYRGVVDLVEGTAIVNIDTVGRMTEGTFEVLCTNVSCFTSNETDWTAVKGSVSGNILTIIAQDNTSTATVSWMVVGERKDQHMIDTDWTDDNGRVITEPLKSS